MVLPQFDTLTILQPVLLSKMKIIWETGPEIKLSHSHSDFTLFGSPMLYHFGFINVLNDSIHNRFDEPENTTLLVVWLMTTKESQCKITTNS